MSPSAAKVRKSRSSTDRHATSSLVAETLEEYGAMTREALATYLPDGYPGRHLYDILSDYPRRPGKMMRPSICIATARAFGASPGEAVRSAVAIELLHNAMLVHDDIQDGSELRRGSPTLHTLHGVPLAINAGDALFLLSLRPLLDNVGLVGGVMGLRILREMETVAWHSLEGQAIELGWIRENTLELSDADYLTMVLKKTCWLATIHPSRMGTLIATRGAIDLDRCIRFGFFLGAAFQIQDDLLNLDGDPHAYGKELSGDLLEGKRTLMLIHVLANCTQAERGRLSSMLAQPRNGRASRDVLWLRERMDAYGSIDYARQVAHGLAGAAQHEFENVFGHLPDSRDKQFLQALPVWVIERN